MKKIKQAQENEKEQQKQAQGNLLQEAFIVNAVKIKFHNCLLRIVDTPYRNKKTVVLGRSLFHPPKFA